MTSWTTRACFSAMPAFVFAFALYAQPSPPMPPSPPSKQEASRDATDWAREAAAAYAEEDWQAAARSYGEARALAPEDPDILFNHALSLKKAGQLEDAAQAYEDHLDLAPKNADAWYAYASTLEALGRPGQAAAAFRRYAEVETREAYARFVEAAREKADELDPTTPTSPDPSGSKEARGEAKAPPMQAPSSRPPSSDLAPVTAALRAQDFETALGLLPAATSDPRSEAARAGALLGLGRAEEAEAAWRRSLEGLSGAAASAARFGLAEALRARGKTGEAKRLFEAVASDPATPETLVELARER